MKLLCFIRARLNERSTWMALGAAAAAGAALSPPWSYIAAVSAFAAGLVPDGPVRRPKCEPATTGTET